MNTRSSFARNKSTARWRHATRKSSNCEQIYLFPARIENRSWNLKLIRIDLQRKKKKNVQRHLYEEGNRLEEKWGAKVAARFDAILNYSFNEANRTNGFEVVAGA